MAETSEIESQVELLILSGAVAAADRDKAESLLKAFQKLRHVSFSSSRDQLGEAQAKLARAVEAVVKERDGFAHLIEELRPLEGNPRFMEAFAGVHAAFQAFDEACSSLTGPPGASGSVIADRQNALVHALRCLKAVSDG